MSSPAKFYWTYFEFFSVRASRGYDGRGVSTDESVPCSHLLAGRYSPDIAPVRDGLFDMPCRPFIGPHGVDPHVSDTVDPESETPSWVAVRTSPVATAGISRRRGAFLIRAGTGSVFEDTVRGRRCPALARQLPKPDAVPVCRSVTRSPRASATRARFVRRTALGEDRRGWHRHAHECGQNQPRECPVQRSVILFRILATQFPFQPFAFHLRRYSARVSLSALPGSIQRPRA